MVRSSTISGRKSLSHRLGALDGGDWVPTYVARSEPIRSSVYGAQSSAYLSAVVISFDACICHFIPPHCLFSACRMSIGGIYRPTRIVIQHRSRNDRSNIWQRCRRMNRNIYPVRLPVGDFKSRFVDQQVSTEIALFSPRSSCMSARIRRKALPGMMRKMMNIRFFASSRTFSQ